MALAKSAKPNFFLMTRLHQLRLLRLLQQVQRVRLLQRV